MKTIQGSDQQYRWK